MVGHHAQNHKSGKPSTPFSSPVMRESLLDASSTGDLAKLESLLSEETSDDREAMIALLLAEATSNRHGNIVEYLLRQSLIRI